MTLSDLTAEDWQERYIRNQQKIVTGTEILGGAFPKPPDLFDGFLLESTVNLLAAEPHTGKTLFSLHLASSLAAGTPLFNFYNSKPRRVLFVGQDSGSWDMAEQLRKLSRGHSINNLDNLDLRLNQGINLFDRSFLKHLEDYHEHVGFDVLIFDTLRQIHSLDENDGTAMGAVMEVLKALRDRFGCTVFVTHHVRKPQFDGPTSELHAARGSGVITGSIDIHVHMTRKDETLTISFPKARGIPRERKQAIDIEIIEDDDDVVTLRKAEVSLTPLEQKLYDSLITPIARPALIEILDVSARQFDNALRNLMRRNLVTSTSRGVYARLSERPAAAA